MKSVEEGGGPQPKRTLLRDIAVLQVKLIVDGFRDLVLVPASLVAGLLSFFSSKDGTPGPQFYRLLVLGKQSEVWINLFGALKNSPQPLGDDAVSAGSDIDDLVGKLESYVVDEYRRGGVTAQARKRLADVLRAFRKER